MISCQSEKKPRKPLKNVYLSYVFGVVCIDRAFFPALFGSNAG